MSPPAATLARSDLFRTLDVDALEDIAGFMTPASFAAGEVVFRQGDRGDRLLVVDEGELDVLLGAPGRDHVRVASFGPGQVVGELALLGDGVRTATVRATRATTGWTLARTAVELIRADGRPSGSQFAGAIGRQSVTRLNDLYVRCAAEVRGAPPAAATMLTHIGEVSPERGEIDYLGGVLFFRGFDRDEIVDITRGMPRLAVPRRAVLTPAGKRPAALWIVARGAIETTMRGADATHSLRLAGPGRAIGHVGLLGHDAFVQRIESRARERSILLEVPWPRVHDLLADDAPASRRFATALWTDTVRALQYGERPLARARTSALH